MNQLSQQRRHQRRPFSLQRRGKASRSELVSPEIMRTKKSDALGNGGLVERCSSGCPIKNGTHKGADECWAGNRTDSSSEPLSYSKQVMSYKPKWRYNPDRRLYKIPERVSVRNSAYILIRCGSRGALFPLACSCLWKRYTDHLGLRRTCPWACVSQCW